MKKILVGKIVSISMNNTVIVETTREVPHRLYKKLMKRSKKFKVDSVGFTPVLNTMVKIVSIRPMSKEKFFKILEVVK